MEHLKRPDRSIKLPESGIELTMTYVVFNDILRFVGTVDEAMSSLLTDQETRNIVIRRLMTQSKGPVEKLEDLIPVEDMEIDIFEIDDLLSWVMEHVAYFFMKTASQMRERVSHFPEAMKTMMSSSPSETGSEP